MSLFRWGPEHEIFLPELDAEHRAIYLAGEELHRALSAGAPAETLLERLNHVGQLSEAHFLHEERLMRDSDFESFEWHRTQHDAVRKRFQALDVNDPLATTAVAEWVAGWLNDHTATADRIMASHVRNWTRRRAA